MRAIQITEFGGPEVLELVELPEPVAPDGHEVIEVDAAGVNYADTHQAENTYLAPQQLPMVPGAEVVGRRADGTRVVALPVGGGYAERAVVHPASTFPVPDGVDDGQALAVVIQGLTAWHLLRTSSTLRKGETVVVHAAAGGVGSLAVQLAKRWGAGRVIGVASTPEKRALAEELGADATVDSGADDLAAALRAANDGRRVDVVLEMAGGPTFDASLAAMAPLGRLVTYGMASRQAPKPINAGELLARSVTVAGFWLVHLVGHPELTHGPVAELMELVRTGELRPVIGGEYPMSEVRRAHADIRSRGTTGKLVLDPKR